jgi:hypothetical protein
LQVKHFAHGGSQTLEPQSTVCLPLLSTLPHFPAQVVDLGSHTHAPGVAPWLLNFFFFFFSTRMVCPFRQSVTLPFFLFYSFWT